jgi:diguanylate cyclase (GGDEF)-like protein
MLDLDGFTRIRDALGDAVADEVIGAVGRHLRKILRLTDLPARYDAERFSVILPGMPKTQAFAVAEKLREAVAGLKPEVGADGYRQLVPLTVSIGVASAGPALTEAAALIESADGALFQAKEAGGDQVRLS